jgi:hypothetical protein
MLAHAGALTAFSPPAILYAVYLIRFRPLPRRRALLNDRVITRNEELTGNKPSVRNLFVFASDAFLFKQSINYLLF